MNELSVGLKCLVMRNGLEIWIDKDKADILDKQLANLSNHIFFIYEGRTINTADITGIFTAQDMEDQTRRKNREWKCRHGNWHKSKENCECLDYEVKKIREAIDEAVRLCGKCKDGWVVEDGFAKKCQCWAKLSEKLEKKLN